MYKFLKVFLIVFVCLMIIAIVALTLQFGYTFLKTSGMFAPTKTEGWKTVELRDGSALMVPPYMEYVEKDGVYYFTDSTDIDAEATKIYMVQGSNEMNIYKEIEVTGRSLVFEEIVSATNFSNGARAGIAKYKENNEYIELVFMCLSGGKNEDYSFLCLSDSVNLDMAEKMAYYFTYYLYK